jgi:hypothetical protein
MAGHCQETTGTLLRREKADPREDRPNRVPLSRRTMVKASKGSGRDSPQVSTTSQVVAFISSVESRSSAPRPAALASSVLLNP